ncbi:hypothetical protein DPEC_G00047290 [Dallia pectoralis]|uniref:Uncharacterized protein n=1 Tax=Dallia pectoralis TaxID=75939 RepID=A0ACC2HAG2_DALPE|nr:hypothetical protein DPEC_G00047290 [Dallia pectoralis]
MTTSQFTGAGFLIRGQMLACCWACRLSVQDRWDVEGSLGGTADPLPLPVSLMNTTGITLLILTVLRQRLTCPAAGPTTRGHVQPPAVYISNTRTHTPDRLETSEAH